MIYSIYTRYATPAVKNYQVDYDELLFRRIWRVIGCILFTGLTIAYTGFKDRTWLVMPSVWIPFMIIQGIFESRFAETIADTQAVDAYKAACPDPRASFRLGTYLSAAQLLLKTDREAALRKMNQNGSTLVKIANFGVFKLLVENGAEITPEHFMLLTANKSSEFIVAILKKTPRFIDLISKEQQVDIWCCLQSRETALLLKRYGFDANIRDEHGYTPLLKLAMFKYHRETYIGPLDGITLEQHLMALLECEADPTFGLESDGKKLLPEDLTDNPLMKTILQQQQVPSLS